MPQRRTAAHYKRVAFVASDTPSAQKAQRQLIRRYGDAQPEAADVIVALGGDGLMLATLQRFMNSGKPIYGMHRGTVGFLMNEFSEQNLAERLAAAQVTVIHPLLMRARDASGRVHRHHAINEVSLFRQSYQAARLRVLVDGEERLSELVADGILLATPARLDRLQSFRAGTDHPDRGAAPGADADQSVPAAALAGRAPA